MTTAADKRDRREAKRGVEKLVRIHAYLESSMLATPTETEAGVYECMCLGEACILVYALWYYLRYSREEWKRDFDSMLELPPDEMALTLHQKVCNHGCNRETVGPQSRPRLARLQTL